MPLARRAPEMPQHNNPNRDGTAAGRRKEKVMPPEQLKIGIGK
jgi:hypothetical protein